MTKKWRHGVMKTNLLHFDPLERVLVLESVLKHKDPTMGRTFFVMSRQHEKIMLVNEAEFGKGLSKLIDLRELVPNEKQDRCTKRAKRLLKDSVYHPKRRETHTYFFKKRRPDGEQSKRKPGSNLHPNR